MRSRKSPKKGNGGTCVAHGMNRVLPGLYIGSFADSQDREQIEQHSITHIVSLRSKPRRALWHPYYLHIPISDTEKSNIAQYFPVCNNFIHKARLDDTKLNNVLVHCYAGVSRSATVVVAYLMTVTGLSWQQALQVVYNVRHVAQPNVSFVVQLKRFQAQGVCSERRRLYKKFPSRVLVAWDHWRTRAILGYDDDLARSDASASSTGDVYYDCSAGEGSGDE